MLNIMLLSKYNHRIWPNYGNISKNFNPVRYRTAATMFWQPPLTGHADLVVVDVIGGGDQNAGALGSGRLAGEVAGGQLVLVVPVRRP